MPDVGAGNPLQTTRTIPTDRQPSQTHPGARACCRPVWPHSRQGARRTSRTNRTVPGIAQQPSGWPMDLEANSPGHPDGPIGNPDSPPPDGWAARETGNPWRDAARQTAPKSHDRANHPAGHPGQSEQPAGLSGWSSPAGPAAPSMNRKATCSDQAAIGPGRPPQGRPSGQANSGHKAHAGQTCGPAKANDG